MKVNFSTSQFIFTTAVIAVLSASVARAAQDPHAGKTDPVSDVLTQFVKPDSYYTNIRGLEAAPPSINQGRAMWPAGGVPADVQLKSDVRGIDAIDLFATLVNFVGAQSNNLYVLLDDGTAGIVYGYSLAYYNPKTNLIVRNVKQAVARNLDGSRHLGVRMDVAVNTTTKEPVFASGNMKLVQKQLYLEFKLDKNGSFVSGNYNKASALVIQMGPAQPLPIEAEPSVTPSRAL